MIIGQGQIDKILSGKPWKKEVQVCSDEAASESKLKREKKPIGKETLKKNQAT